MLRKFYAAILLTLLAMPAARATHISGGEIYWDCVGPNQYEITLVVYRDCAGINLNSNYNLPVWSPCDTLQVNVSTPGGTEISQLCDIELPNSTCNGGSLPGVEQYVYTGIITLPPCDFWTVAWWDNWRNNAIVNLQNPGSQDIYIEATLNNIVAPCESSPEFTNLAIPYVCMGYPISYSYGVYDAEGDSLAYSLIGARTTAGAPIPYVAPHTPTNPIPGLTLDPTTGQLNFTLTQAGDWVVVVQVDIFDAFGNHIGTVMRDMQFIAYPCSNQPPDPTTGTIANPTGTGTQTGPYELEVCESGQFCFDMVISDPNAGDDLTATSNVSSNLPGATFGFTGSNPITCTVCWNAGASTAGFYPFIVTVDDGACPIPAFQTYVYAITVIPGLFANVQATDETCAGNGDGSATVSVTTGSGPFGYLWNTGATGPAITAGAGSYSVVVTDANGCATAPLPATINADAQPNLANAGPDAVACLGDLPVTVTGSILNAAGGIWSGGAGSFGGSGLTVDYMPSAAELAAGGVDLILTTTGNAGCPPDADTVHIALSDGFPGGTINGIDASCNGAMDGSAAFAPTDPGYTYQWNDPATQTTSTATGLGAGTYTVQVTDALGCDTTLNVTIGQPSAITITGVQTTDESCVGMDDGSVSVTVTGGTMPYSYTWSTGDTTATITVGAGTYGVTVTDANGCAPDNATAVVYVVSQPNAADAGPDLMACMDALPVDLQGTVVNAGGGAWSGGNGSFIGSGLTVQYQPSASEIASGGVDLVLATTGNGSCPGDADTVHVTLSNSFLAASISGTDVLCAGDTTGTATFLPNAPGLSYAWNDPAAQTGNTATGLDAGIYSITVTDPLGCDTTMTITINEPPPLAITLITSTDVTCNGGSDGSATAIAGGGAPGYSYQWTGGQSGSTASNLAAGLFTVVVTDANGCTAQANAFVNAPPPVTLAAQVPDTVCVNAPVQLTAQAGGGTAPYAVAWSGIGMGDTLGTTFSSSQTVNVSVIDGAGCAGPTITFNVTVLDLFAATLSAYGDTVVCPGGSATVGAALTGYPAPVTIAWPELFATGAGPFTVPVSGDQTLNVSASDACGNTISDVVVIELDVPPTFTLPSLIAEGCEPLTVQMPDVGITTPVTYLWDFGDGSTSAASMPTHTYDAGTYSVSLTITTAFGCTSTGPTTGEVIVYPNPVAAFTADPWTTDADNSEINFTDQSLGGINVFDWDFGDGGVSSDQNPSHDYPGVGAFQVTLWVQDLNGCTDQITQLIQIDPVYDVVIPNAFTPDPNGGGGGTYDPLSLANDVFYPFIRFVDDFKMRIYDRWGELVFESNDLKVGWDGYYRGEMSQQDVYAYQIWVRFVDGREVQKLGDITLFR